MAYFTRNKMLTMVLELYTANHRFAQGGTGDDAADLQVLIGCQQKALVLGEYLESMGMDYSDIVEKFENYCNMIYDISENLNDANLIIDHKLDIECILSDILNGLYSYLISLSLQIFKVIGISLISPSIKVSFNVNLSPLASLIK